MDASEKSVSRASVPPFSILRRWRSAPWNFNLQVVHAQCSGSGRRTRRNRGRPLTSALLADCCLKHCNALRNWRDTPRQTLPSQVWNGKSVTCVETRRKYLLGSIEKCVGCESARRDAIHSPKAHSSGCIALETTSNATSEGFRRVLMSYSVVV